MSRFGGICDVRCQAFITATIENEKDMRRRWFIKNKDLILKHQKKQDERIISGVKKEFKLPKKKKKKVREIIKEEEVIISSPAENEHTNFRSISMKTVDLKVKNILYEPKVESFTAKNNYLSVRYENKPEDRFYYPECTSWIYGWHQNNKLDNHPTYSPFGIRSIIQSTFYSRDASSLKIDPDWYRMCQTKNAKNYDEILT